MNKEQIKREIQYKVNLVEEALNKYMPGETSFPETIHEAMRYSTFAGGKRLRPVLFLSAVEAVGGSYEELLPAACAFELIHTYSLIHDDLPALDNDNFRRGKPTSHKVFGEAMAVLAGDALLTMAFGMIAECRRCSGVSPEAILRVISDLAAAAGSMGMIGGQVLDIQSENKSIDLELLRYIHANKTGALFRVSITSGALLAGASDEQLAVLTEYAHDFGLAFQITDDILDVEGDFAKLGKTIGSDQQKKKSTYPSLMGLEESKTLAAQSVERAVKAVEMFADKGNILRFLAESLVTRDK